jgi:hypothetical protein
MNNEDESISWRARKAWDFYNPEWLLDKVDSAAKDDDDDTPFDIGDVRQAYIAGFKAGVVFKITKEIPKEDK